MPLDRKEDEKKKKTYLQFDPWEHYPSIGKIAPYEHLPLAKFRVDTSQIICRLSSMEMEAILQSRSLTSSRHSKSLWPEAAALGAVDEGSGSGISTKIIKGAISNKFMGISVSSCHMDLVRTPDLLWCNIVKFIELVMIKSVIIYITVL